MLKSGRRVTLGVGLFVQIFGIAPLKATTTKFLSKCFAQQSPNDSLIEIILSGKPEKQENRKTIKGERINHRHCNAIQKKTV